MFVAQIAFRLIGIQRTRHSHRRVILAFAAYKVFDFEKSFAVRGLPN